MAWISGKSWTNRGDFGNPGKKSMTRKLEAGKRVLGD